MQTKEYAEKKITRNNVWIKLNRLFGENSNIYCKHENWGNLIKIFIFWNSNAYVRQTE